MAQKQQLSIFKRLSNWWGGIRSRSVSPPSLSNPAAWLTDLFNLSSGTRAKKAVNENTAMGISAVYNGVQLIATALASLPVSVYERMPDGSRREAFDHPLYYLVHDEPNPFMSAMTFWETLLVHTIMHGNGYAVINRNGAFEISSFTLKLPGTVQPYVHNGELFYMVKNDITQEIEPKLPRDIFHVPGLGFNGITGRGLLEVAKEVLSGAIAVNDFGNEFFGNGGHPGYAVEVPGKLDPEKWAFVKRTWREKVENHDIAPLDGGMKLHTLGIENDKAQFLGTKQNFVEEVARILNLPTSKLKHSEKPSYNNVEQDNINYVVDALRPWAKRVEGEARRKGFQESQKGRFTVRFNLDGLLRGDVQSRSNYYQKMFYIGALSPNDIRRLENMNPREGGDEYFIQTNMTTTALLLQGDNNN